MANDDDFPIGDVTIVEGDWDIDFPAVIIDVDFARRALERNELPMFVGQALKAMELSGRRFAFLKEAE